MQAIRIIEITDCKMVSSGIGTFGEEKFDRFDKWFSSLPETMHPRDFLYQHGSGYHWMYMYDESMDVPEEFDVIDFKGGLYAVATDIDRHTKMRPMQKAVDKFLKANGLVRDNNRPWLGNIISHRLAQRVMGYAQMDYYMP